MFSLAQAEHQTYDIVSTPLANMQVFYENPESTGPILIFAFNHQTLKSKYENLKIYSLHLSIKLQYFDLKLPR